MLLQLPNFKKVSVLLILFSFCTILKASELVLLHTNDHHGHYIQDPKKKFLGMAARKTLVDQLRLESKKKGRFVLLASGGDINTGTPESDFFDAEPDFKAMNMTGYDAMALGNHEFDNPFKVLLKQKKWANFPFLAANIYLSKGQKEYKNSVHGKNDRPFLPYIVKNYGGKKVLIVGLTTEESAQFTKVKEVIFRPAVEEAKELIPRLNKEIKPDLTIVLSHLGYFIKGKHRGYPADYSLAKALGKKDLDIIVGGHTQKALATPHIVNGVAILQAGEWGKYLGKMVIDIQGGRKYKIKSYELLGVNYTAISSDFARPEDVANIGKVKRVNIKEDSEVASYLREFYKKYPKKLDESFAVLDSDFLGRGKGRGKETNLGRLISHSFCYITNSDVCFFNNGGLRIGLDKGSVTRRDILSLMPFGNEICHLKLKTKDLVNYIEKIYKATKKRSTHYYGVNFEVLKDKILELSVNIESNIHSLEANKALRPVYSRGNVLINKTFEVATTCFLSRGRDGYPNMEKLKSHEKISLNDGIDYTDALVFIDFLKQKKKITGKEYLKKTVILER